MYHVIGTGLTAILLYLISYFFYRLDFFSYQFHKKLWNAILAVVFLAATIAGVFMALQITYKWDIPYVKTILKWHVEFGIGMAFTGIFHFIWHFPYFTRIFERHPKKSEITGNQQSSTADPGVNLFVVGLVSSTVQLLLIREMLNIAGGYELITGIFLGSWLIASAIGAALAASSGLTDIRKINLTFSLSPLLSLFLLFFLTRMFLTSGETPSLLVSLIYTLLVLIPFCMVSGFTFVRLISFARTTRGSSAGKSFATETAGGVLSGILVAILTSGLLGTYKILFLTIILCTAYVVITCYSVTGKAKTIARITFLLLAIIVIMGEPDRVCRQLLLTGISVSSSTDTPYGNITRGKYKGEESTYYNHRLLTYNSDVTEREENVHYGMLQSDNPERVLLISGSPASMLPELLKYPVKEITYIERDPALSKQWPAIHDTAGVRIRAVNTDAFRYILESEQKSDVVILTVPPPSTLQLNRYYTTEFYKAVKEKLRDGGVFMCSPGSGNDYFNKESIELYSSIYNSLAAVFGNVRPVVGNKLYFIASDSPVSVSFCKLTTKRGISNVYVGCDYLSDDLTENKTNEFTALIDRSAKQNRSALPVASYHYQAFTFSKYAGEKIPAIILMVVLFALPSLLTGRRLMAMYFSASALAGFEIIILLTLQIMIGNMYQLTGLVLAGLMAGLAAGAGSERIRLLNAPVAAKVLLLVLIYGGAGLVYSSAVEIRQEWPVVIILVLAAIIPAVLTGRLFTDLTSGSPEASAVSAVYGADLAGSALGFILVSGFAIPVLGIRDSLFLLAALVFAGFIFSSSRK
jgi:spermidine synthase